MELGQPEDISNLYFSKYEIPKDLKILSVGILPYEMLEFIYIEENQNECFESETLLRHYINMLPLIMACSVKKSDKKNEENKLKQNLKGECPEEYYIPQLLTRWVVENLAIYDGIEYFSTQVPTHEEADSLRSLADELNISLLKLRKLLITADVFTSDICTEINDLHQSGKKIPEIMKLTGLSRASVHSYLPYTKGLYNAAEISLNAERCRTYKNRQEQVRLLQEIPSEENLWQAVIAFQDYPFKTATGLPFRYKLKVGKNGEYNRELLIDRREKSKSLAWSSVVLAFENSKRISEEVKKPKALGDIRGVSYIYSILWRFGLIRVPEAIEKNMGKQR